MRDSLGLGLPRLASKIERYVPLTQDEWAQHPQNRWLLAQGDGLASQNQGMPEPSSERG